MSEGKIYTVKELLFKITAEQLEKELTELSSEIDQEELGLKWLK